MQVGAGEERLVVQHLLEVGHEPERVGRVAREPTAHVVVDAAGRHRVQRRGHHAEGLLLAAQVGAQEEVERHRRGELRRPSEPAVGGVERAPDPVVGLVEHREHEVGVAAGQATGERVRLDRGDELLGLLGHLLALVGPDVGDRLHDPREPRHPGPVRRGEVRARVERPGVGSEEHGHRPAALTGEGLHRVHVDRVHVGPLLAVDLHVHEETVHHRRDLGVLERLVRHHVAPVAGGVAHGQEDRAVGRVGDGERLVAPGVPVDGIVGVLAQVGARLARRVGSPRRP